MALLYIDTNVFLDFYQASNERLKVFHELVQRADNVILTEQTVREFRRNRAARLADLARNIDKHSKPQPFTTAVVREIEGFDKLIQFRDDYERQAKSLANSIRKWISDEPSDLVLTEFNNLLSSCTVLPTTVGNIEKAHQRKLLGEPPTSPDKHTIGDELIWETLLKGCNGDLIIVSRDATFLDNASILAAEFKNSWRNLLLVTASLGEALATLHIPSVEIEDAEEKIKASQSDGCPRCGGTIIEVTDPDSTLVCYECIRCGEMFFPLPLPFNWTDIRTR